MTSGNEKSIIVHDDIPSLLNTSAEDSRSQGRRKQWRWRRLLSMPKVEARGIEPIPEDERQNAHSINLLLLWFSTNTQIANVSLGILGPKVFNLSVGDTIATAIGFQLIGALSMAFIASLGPRLGMRTMVITRYSFGYWGATIISLLNILSLIGWIVLGVILSGQILHNVNNNLPIVVGVIIIRYNSLHYYEKYAWPGMVAIFIMMYALGGHAGNRVANVLNYGATMYAAVASWAAFAADYNCRLPANTPAIKIFSLTTIGNMIPNTFAGIVLGALLVTVPSYSTAFDEGDTSGVLQKVFEPWGRGGDFILVLGALSSIAGNGAMSYSLGLATQTLLPAFGRIPRSLLTVLGTIIYTVIAIAGRDKFTPILTNFLAILGYWVSPWFIVIFEEHLIFRPKNGLLGGYKVGDYASPKNLPVGLAACLATILGIVGAIMGMAQAWYVGPIARIFGFGGADTGFEIATVITGLLYPLFRYLEIKKWNR
ncbi:hypothetical protein M422DRAFT_231673 [Sphaerobolus stellatus SS14]|uniref:Cytosine permease n=1 Tax=Sphaerobolus stellatus (strain SS14) TaxID=990650 RepID=A0A0C9VJM4_SPHS4|nr:hypothetical protein M422DRAFT_231673 [Sphaerobolus stellatus SS14]